MTRAGRYNPPHAQADARCVVPRGLVDRVRGAAGTAPDVGVRARRNADLAGPRRLRQGPLLGRVRLRARAGRGVQEQRVLSVPRRPARRRDVCGRSRQEARAHDARRDHQDREVLRRSGLHHPPAGSRRHLLHARRGEDEAARRVVAALADGRRTFARRAADRHRSRASRQGGRPRVRRSRRAHRRLRRRLQGTDRRRAVHARHHEGHAARKLVDGQEPHGDAVRAARERRRVQDRGSGAGSRMASAWAIHAARSGSSICCT